MISFIKNSDIHTYRTRNGDKLRIPEFKLNIRRLSIRIKGAYVWNFVTGQMSFECKLSAFKKLLRKLLSGNKFISNIIP